VSGLYHLGVGVLKPLTHLLYRPTILGAHNVPATGGVILASNHLSFIDSFAIPLAAPRHVRFIAKQEYFTGTGIGGSLQRGFFEGIGAIPVDRHSSRAAQESLDLALEVLHGGGAFGIYPEGTRSRDGRLYRGRTGVAWLALTAKVPVVPVALRGTDAIQPVGARLPTIASVSVTFGAPLDIAGQYGALPAGKGRRLATDAVMDAIAALSGQERADTYNDLPPDADPDRPDPDPGPGPGT